MSPIAATGLTARELTALRTALAPVGAAAAAPDLGRARIAAQLLWRERMGSLARTPAR
jgi:hypothetical protein